MAYFILVFYALIRITNGIKHVSHSAKRHSSRAKRFINYIILAILMPNFLLIGIINPNLKVCFQNVQGLIPFYELDKSHPKLYETKIYEINTYINNRGEGGGASSLH